MSKILKLIFTLSVLIGIVIGAARLTVLRWWQVPADDPVLSASITPTLNPGDWVLLWRATPPAFGSLVICPDPEETGRIVIGRLVGEENDRLKIDGDRIYLNDREAHTETACAERVFHVDDPNTGSEVDQQCTMEALGGVLHKRGDSSGLGAPVPPSARTVGEGKVFLVSDNRAYPYDSRTYGSVDRATCKESIFFRLVSKDGYLDVKNRLTYIQ